MRRGILLGSFFLICLVGGGCGTGTVPVKGFVRLNGDPVAGAQVTFISEDGKNVYTGFSNTAGEFEVVSGTVRGALPGQYKVTVIKSPPGASMGGAEPGDTNYMKDMMASAKEASKSAPGMKPGGASGPPMGMMRPGMPGGGMMMPPGGMMPGMSSNQIKSELPQAYAQGTTTPLKVTIPHEGPIMLDLKGDAPKKAPEKK
jgi:hypothetical protein